jgi:hypothetical protein
LSEWGCVGEARRFSGAAVVQWRTAEQLGRRVAGCRRRAGRRRVAGMRIRVRDGVAGHVAGGGRGHMLTRTGCGVGQSIFNLVAETDRKDLIIVKQCT